MDLKSSSREIQPTYHFMMKCLLYSRMETGLISNKDYYDEDVNVYIAHLLNAFLSPAFLEQANKYLSPYDMDVFCQLSNSTDARLKYLLYKTNADFLLISLGIFDKPGKGASGEAGPGLNVEVSTEDLPRSPAEEAYIGRGKTYYHFAYTYSQQIHNARAAITEVLEKLSLGFDKYTRILSHMRGEYLDLMKRFSRGEVYHLERSVSETQKNDLLRQKQDELLDLYTEWKQTKSPELRKKMDLLVEEIRKLDPQFKFDIKA
jgi:hypothetical protein